jgi:CRISPR-associated endonuclease Cas2
MRWIVAYDVSGNLPRERVAVHLQRSGVRLQRSVFQVESVTSKTLLSELAEHLDLNVDVVQMFRQCRSCEQESASIGQYGPVLQERWWVA